MIQYAPGFAPSEENIMQWAPGFPTRGENVIDELHAAWALIVLLFAPQDNSMVEICLQSLHKLIEETIQGAVMFYKCTTLCIRRLECHLSI